MSRYSIVDEILFEREKQDIKWGVQNHDPLRFYAILAEEVGEVAKEVVEWAATDEYLEKCERIENLRKELIQTAAVAVAFAEALDRNH